MEEVTCDTNKRMMYFYIRAHTLLIEKRVHIPVKVKIMICVAHKDIFIIV